VRNPIGSRLKRVRASMTQPEMAELMGIAHRTYASYERDERIPDADALARLAEAGWNANWLLTGEGPERLEASSGAALSRSGSVVAGVSHSMNLDVLKMAVGLADQQLGRSTHPDYAEIVSLIYDLVLEGLPEAQIVSIAGRQASSRRARDGGTGHSQEPAEAPSGVAAGGRRQAG
jgi:transcriptional regulator with XRE-family HTH domain